MRIFFDDSGINIILMVKKETQGKSLERRKTCGIGS